MRVRRPSTSSTRSTVVRVASRAAISAWRSGSTADNVTRGPRAAQVAASVQVTTSGHAFSIESRSCAPRFARDSPCAHSGTNRRSRMRPYHVAIVGSGPSGFFAASSLLKAADGSEDIDVAVDMLEMLPTPWGLVRSGVAPDHPKIKSISKQFEKTSQDPRFRFFGNVSVGEHVQASELAERYDAVVYAVGAQSDRALNIPGEELQGSIAAVDFVGWYNAHPNFEAAT